MSGKSVKFRDAVRLAKERTAGHVINFELDAFYGGDVLDDYSEECWEVLEKAQHHVAKLINNLRKPK